MPKKTKNAHFLSGGLEVWVVWLNGGVKQGRMGWRRDDGRGGGGTGNIPSEGVDSDTENEPVDQFAVGEEVEG